MKQFLKGVVEWKASACFLYTGAMFLYLLFSTVFHNDEISLTMLWTLFLVSVLATLIQGICFSNWIFKKLRYTWRSLLFIALFLPTLTLTAYRGGPRTALPPLFALFLLLLPVLAQHSVILPAGNAEIDVESDGHGDEDQEEHANEHSPRACLIHGEPIRLPGCQRQRG